MKSIHAQAAKAIKKELKERWPNVNWRIRSSIFSGGTSVYIRWIDGPTQDEVRQIVGKYQYGYFDGMEDLYKITNRRNDIPQVKYVQLERELSPQYVIELCRKWGYTPKADEIHQTNEELFKSHKVWTYYNLAWLIERSTSRR